MKNCTPFWRTLFVLLVQGAALLLFSTGFFQLRHSPSAQHPPDAHYAAWTRRLSALAPPRPVRVFDRLIFTVIDALRADFVYGERFVHGFPWLGDRVARGTHARSVVAMARAPTVTMPRLKALTAGTAPLFLDLLTNLDMVPDSAAPPAMPLDSWIEQLHRDNRTLLLYGDDTWLRLFPGRFSADSQGTHSFFVTDTIEVDRNVTRHLPDALARRDWDVLVLHYLGVDHIGHLSGPHSPLMIPKLQEMDGVLATLYGAIEQRDREDGTRTLLVVLGDHGMTEGGNHGGSSREECETACVFLSPHYAARVSADRPPRDGVAEQVDLAPTLSLFLGLPVPSASTGKLLLAAVPEHVALADLLWIQSRNALQLHLQISTSRAVASADRSRLLPLLSRAVECHAAGGSEECRDAYDEFCTQASDLLTANTGEYDVGRLVFGVAASLLGLGCAVLGASWPVAIAVAAASLLAALGFGVAAGVLLALASVLCWHARPGGAWPRPTLRSDGLGILFCAAYAATQFSSTFIEEEHEYWYFVFPTLLLCDAYAQQSLGWQRIAPPLVLFRVLRSWNATGFAHQSDSDVRLLLNTNPHARSALLAASLSAHAFWQGRSGGARSLYSWLYVATAGAVFAFKEQLVPSADPVLFARVLLALCAVLIAAAQARRRRGQTVLALGLALVLLLKTHNAFPVLLVAVLGRWIDSDGFSHPTKLALLHASFFLLGPSHTIASIDFGPAYLGQRSFQPAAVAALTFIITWAGPILTSAPLCRSPAPLAWTAAWRSAVHTTVLASLLLQRHHIFVWTVFAPRLLFEYAWTAFYAALLAAPLLARTIEHRRCAR